MVRSRRIILFIAFVVGTPDFERAAKKARVTEIEFESMVVLLSELPDSGDIIRGSGGARKLRIAKKGGGKSGGYRVITYFGGGSLPVYLLDIYSKSDKDDLSQPQVKELRGVCKSILAAHRKVKA